MNLRRLGEKVLIAIAWAIPRKVVYWCAIRLWAHGTMGKFGNTAAPSLTVDEALRRWDL